MNKRPLLVPAVALAASLMAACGSSKGPDIDASAAPMVYASSTRAPADIARCLENRLSHVNVSTVDGVTRVTVGSDYLVTLTPSRGGSVLKVQTSKTAPDNPPEPEMRFSVARCTT